ncbi:MAG: ABC transporter ATP-binding protein [Clostridiales Family XIII bacterium]|jgi:putative ABC transport system ATP-binding protein|nr:ABC transporter ATP-binding protein [Clostridiales Family XIII bacterium]
MFVETENISKSYGAGGSHAQVLSGVSMQVAEGSVCVILGPSGSGKSTLLNVIGGLDAVDGGHIRVGGLEVTGLAPAALSEYRRSTLGFVFQFYNLIPNLTVAENIEVCAYLSDDPLDVGGLLETMDIWDQRGKFPPQLSGGQQQRCALARALVKNPKLLLCDEPTGALDSATAKDVLILLEKVNRAYGTTMLIVTHNEAVSGMAHQVVKLRDGMIQAEYANSHPAPAAELVW